MTGHPDAAALETIASRDPSGNERQPTDDDYAAHRQWAIDTYGEGVWHTYNHVPWGTWGTDPV